jgi:D-alanine-D-alanine ligase
MTAVHVVVLYNAPTLEADHPDYASEAGVLEAVDAVSAALGEAGRRVSRVPVDRVAADRAGQWLGDQLLRLRPDVVFNLFEGFNGGGYGQGHVAGLVELLGFSFTGAGPASLLLTQDKARCNWLLQGAGVATPNFCFAPRGRDLDRAALEALLAEGPVIVKPACEDASLGIGVESVVASADDALRQAALLADRYGDVLVERFIAGREFNVAIVGWPNPRLLPLAEIEFDPRLAAEERLVTYDAKWSPLGAADLATPVRCPANVDPELRRRIEQAGLAAFELTGCRDYARIDVRVDDRGRVFVLDVNNNCDLSPSAGLARGVRIAGQSYSAFIAELVDGALARRRTL